MKKVSGGTTTLYFYDTEGKLIEEYIPATGMGKDYLWMPKSYEPVARIDFSMTDADTGDVLRCSKSSPNVHLDWSLFSGGGNFVMRRGIIGNFSSYSNIFGPSTLKTCDDPVLENTTSYWYDTRNRSLTDTLYFYHSDHLGTPIAMTDTSGSLVWRAEHSPFGGIYALPVSTVGNNLRFPGQYFDSETGLAQNWFRDYEAKIGRYWEVDQKKISPKYQDGRYVYAQNNSLKYKDFQGLCTSDTDCLICIVYAEAGGTGVPDACKIAVAWVVKNRVGKPGFGIQRQSAVQSRTSINSMLLVIRGTNVVAIVIAVKRNRLR